MNVHPTKQEVCRTKEVIIGQLFVLYLSIFLFLLQVEILHGDALIEQVVGTLKETLEGANSSRVFEAQTFLPTSLDSDKEKSSNSKSNDTKIASAAAISANKRNRMDSRDTRVDGYLSSSQSIKQGNQKDRNTVDGAAQGVAKEREEPTDDNISSSYYAAAASRVAQQPMKPVYLSSVKELLQEIANRSDPTALDIIRSYVFVGMVDKCRSLIQVHTRLLLVDHRNLAIQFFYQQAIRFFSNFKSISLDPPVSLKVLLRSALQSKQIVADPPATEESLEEESNQSADFLGEQSEMLNEYFGIHISKIHGQWQLLSIPCLLDEYVPSYQQLPAFIARLIWNVNWNEEKECFRGVSTALGEYYGDALPLHSDQETGNSFLR